MMTGLMFRQRLSSAEVYAKKNWLYCFKTSREIDVALEVICEGMKKEEFTTREKVKV